MEIRKRSPKAVARRHDLNYFKKGSALRQWQWKLAGGAIAFVLVWVAVVSMTRGRELLSKGPISSSHAVFGAKCEACHVDMQGAPPRNSSFRRHVSNSACQSCHEVPDHQSKLTLASFKTPECGVCHVEHTGSMMLANAPDLTCTSCHADLKSSHYASNIHSFTEGHPQFAPLRAGYEDGQQIEFNHQAHMQRGLKGPNGEIDMTCADCHRTPAARTLMPWRFEATPQLRNLSLDLDSTDVHPSRPATKDRSDSPASPLHPTDNRAYMAASTYAENCSACHTLNFDKHISEEAPHGSPEEVRRFIREKMQAYAAQNPQVVAEEILHLSDESTAKVPQYRTIPIPHNVQEWVAVRSRQAERRLWYQSCNLCHVMKIPDDSPAVVAASLRSEHDETLTAHATTAATLPLDNLKLPTVTPTKQKARWFTDAVFSHQAHIAVSCESCHARTRNSNQGDDILLPGIASCQKCHDGRSSPQGPALASGHAESGCFLCHQYHDWNHPQTTPVTPRNLDFKEMSELSPLKY